MLVKRVVVKNEKMIICRSAFILRKLYSYVLSGLLSGSHGDFLLPGRELYQPPFPTGEGTSGMFHTARQCCFGLIATHQASSGKDVYIVLNDCYCNEVVILPPKYPLENFNFVGRGQPRHTPVKSL